MSEFLGYTQIPKYSYTVALNGASVGTFETLEEAGILYGKLCVPDKPQEFRRAFIALDLLCIRETLARMHSACPIDHGHRYPFGLQRTRLNTNGTERRIHIGNYTDQEEQEWSKR